MVLPTLLLAIAGIVAVLYWYLQGRREPMRAALYVGCAVGLLRATLATAGWYAVEHTGGPLQGPAFALAMLAWPEAMLFAERRATPAPMDLYLRLSLLVVASTVVFFGLIGALATRRRAQGSNRD